MSLRLRVALAGLGTVGVVLLATGWWLSASLERDGRDQVDRQLAERAQTAAPPAVSVAFGSAAVGAGKPAKVAVDKAKLVQSMTTIAPPPPGSKLLQGSGVFTIVAAPDGIGKIAGDVPPGAQELATTVGYSTRRLGGQTWRVLVTAADDGTVATLGQSLEPVLDRVATTRGLLLRLGLLALAATGLVGFAIGSVALRPLQRLRRRAEAIGVGAAGDDGGALSDGGPPEVAALGGALDGMLARLRESAAQTEQALESTRRFAGDAGHELRTPLAGMAADIGVLQDRAVAMAPDARDAVASLAGQHLRLAALLDALQTLALGDARSALAFAPVDLVDVAEQAVASARRRHPGRDLALDVDTDRALVFGWADGLRAIADNLVENALRHGGPQAAVALRVRARGEDVELCVDDGGPGVPAGERELVFERFGRGRGAAPGGSGLGLSIVAQQAALHGGRVDVGDSPCGGARFVVALPLLAEASAPAAAAVL